VRERRARDDVADRRDPLGRAHVLADVDQAVGADGDPGLRQPQLVGVGHAADRDDHALGLDAVLAAGAFHHERAVLEALRGRLEAQVDVQRAQAVDHRRGERLVDGRQHAVERLDHRHAGAELGQRGPQLEADVAGAHDGNAVRDRGHRQRAGRVQHALAVEGQAGKRDGARAGGDDRVLELEEGDAVLGRAHGDAVGAVEARLAVDHAHLARLEQPADALREAGAQLAAPGLEALERDAHAVGAQPGVAQVARALRRVGQLDERLAGDAADLQAHAAQAGGARALDERHPAAELGGADGGGVAARPSAEDEQVDGVGELADDHQRRSSKSRTGSSRSFAS
jgi:hypothetical protein